VKADQSELKPATGFANTLMLTTQDFEWVYVRSIRAINKAQE
jgi:hypothetical protein